MRGGRGELHLPCRHRARAEAATTAQSAGTAALADDLVVGHRRPHLGVRPAVGQRVAGQLRGADLTGEGEGDDEAVKVNLATVPAQVDRIVFPVSIHDAENRGQSFGQVRNAFIPVINQANNQELARYDLSEDASTETAMVFGELYRHGADWKFRAVGQGYASGLAGIAADFGVNV
ncbi:hypothetical protein SVIOM342S_01821 [Streptomyces violaceorubidus]